MHGSYTRFFAEQARAAAEAKARAARRDQSEDRPQGAIVYGQETPQGLRYGVLHPDGTSHSAAFSCAQADMLARLADAAAQRRHHAAARAAADVEADSNFNRLRSPT